MADGKRNILLIIADDLGRTLGCYGDTRVPTPNIDRLAAEGVKFDHAFTSTASCSGSRSVIYTGLHTHQNGQYGLQQDFHHFITFDYVDTAPKVFNEFGYLTAIVGKVHVGPDHVYPWIHRFSTLHRDVRRLADEARKVMEEAKDADMPFFLTVAYFDPHRDLTRKGFGNDQDYPDVDDPFFDPANVTIPDFLPDLPEAREEFVEYYRAISRLDQGVGMLMAELVAAGEADDTLVLFISDNGPPFINSKSTLYDAGVRLPFIMRKPNGAVGIVNPNLISYVDILPTFIEWSGHDIMPGLRRGRSILPVLGMTTRHLDWCEVYGSHTFHEVTNYYPTRFLRNERYKYHKNIAWKLDFPFAADLYGSLTWEGIKRRPGTPIGERPVRNYLRRPHEELYDLEADPREVNNLAAIQIFRGCWMRCGPVSSHGNARRTIRGYSATGSRNWRSGIISKRDGRSRTSRHGNPGLRFGQGRMT